MATQTIDATLFASSHPDIAKRTSVSGLIISLVMMVVGILIFVSIFEMNDKSSSISMGHGIDFIGSIPFVLEIQRNRVPAYGKRGKGTQRVFRFEIHRQADRDD